ncbi:baseplate hub assembly catalyst [Vibrio phage D479]
MLPFEREIYAMLLTQHIKQKEEQMKNGIGQ